jgi:hypothetical protein
MNRTCRIGSVIGHEVHNRQSQDYDMRLYRDYFSKRPTYPDKFFRHRFRMRRSLFLRIARAVEEHDNYFVQRRNDAGALNFSCLQKVTAAYSHLAYVIPTDYVDEYVRIGESTAIECLRRYVKVVCEVFGEQYLRPLNEDDTARLLNIAERRRFLGMLGSIDCIHWKWKDYPTTWQGMYCGHVKEPTVILETVASHDLWI